ncbi:NAD(P)-dependent oxidoreductase [Lactobacillus ultunensis]|uniref:NAD(P)-binding domain-containing protein n=1 Tax=Lactobacillus ultunensis DSM 16047 TaxID=525365 RepID=C2ENT7_9LACO|nr:NAD(P)-binding oxidoreductase [Lactobacillus ultunensis]EEJ71795.1 hypothetical protein HMPREF0548_1333 [Lactobacillus ultunensis DSM 16047]KRL79860.1 NADH-flavin reductase family protein [Lactobacillus ultunensis DSM 16047]QQP28582.1 SDR family oxidoreductase [Lactobacillus ultunensis]
MKIFLIGATGRTGNDVLMQALAQNDKVVAYARHPQKLSEHSNLKVIKGELTDINRMSRAMKGCDAVLVTLGNPMSNSSGRLFTFAIPNIIKAMDNSSVKRLISLSALGVGKTYANTRYPYKMGAKGFLKGNFADHEAGENKLPESDLNWTTVHPGPLFNGHKTKKPLVRDAESGFKMPGAPRTYREDVAQVMLRIIDDPKTYGKQLIMCSKQDNVK